MGTTDLVQGIFFDGQAIAVDTERIELTLRHLWTEGREGERGVVRACMANLVIYAGTPEQALVASQVVADITAMHLVRALILVTDEMASETGVQAWLSAHCQLPKVSGLRVCCEQVTLEATGEAAERLPSAVLPLLAPDLPVILWWMGDPPFGADVFEHLIDAADRLIVDTSSFEEASFSVTRLATLIRTRSDHIAVTDLNWARLTAWQDQVAQMFDTPETIPYLERLERLTIRYLREGATGRLAPEEALLLAGWLLNRLGWKQPPALARIAPGHFRGRLRRAGREFAVEIAPQVGPTGADAGDRGGMLLSVEMKTNLGGREADFLVERRPEDFDVIATIVSLPDMTPLVSTRVRPHRSLASLLADDLSRLEHDYLFEASLETAAHLSGAMQLLPR